MLKRMGKILLVVSCIFVFVYLRRPVTTNDTYFGLKIGEYIVEHRSIPDREIFSWSAAGRPIVMYEWLTQVLIYLLFKIGGFPLIESYTAVMGVLIFSLVYLLFRRAFQQPWWVALAFSWLGISSIAEFITPRPYLVAFVGFLVLFYLIFRYLFFGHSPLWLLLPMTYIWTNSHASFIFVPGFLIAFALFAPQRRKTFLTFSALTTLVTFLPPLWYHPHQWLFHFFQYLPVLSRYVMEWKPLGEFSFNQRWYGGLTIGTLFFSFALSRVTRQLFRWVFAAPLILLALVSFQAIRHVVFGTLSLILALGLFLPSHPVKYKRLTIPLLLIILATTVWLLIDKRSRISREQVEFQQQTLLENIDFLRRVRLDGHMLNEFSLGSYLLYYLYPEYQVMIDARADVYMCCELADLLPIVEAKHASRDVFSQAVDTFLRKYDVSYFIVPYSSQNPLVQTSTTLMADTLLDNPDWRLIYASDDWQILLRNDGRNQQLWDEGTMKAVTPYRLSEFRSNRAVEAQREYEQLIVLEDSGIAENGLGVSLLSQGKTDEAKIHFERAVERNPYLGKPHLGVAQIAFRENDMADAISHLKQAVSLSPYLGEAHLLLGQALDQDGQKQEAIRALNTGLDADIDLLSRQRMAQLLHKLQD